MLGETCRRFAEALLPGGVAIIEPWIFPEDWQPGFLGLLVVDQADLKAARSSSSGRSGNKSHIHFAFAISDHSGTRAFEEQHELTLFSDQEYRDALRQAGFEVTQEATSLFPRSLYVAKLT
jgi:hypothetical protein